MPTRASLTLARLTSKRRPPSVPLTRWRLPPTRDRASRGAGPEMRCRRLQLAVRSGTCRSAGRRGRTRSPCSDDRRARRAWRSRRAGRRSSSRSGVRASAWSVAAIDLAAEVDDVSSTADSVRPGRPRSRAAARTPASLVGVSGVGANRLAVRGCTACTACAGEERLDGACGAVAEVAAEHRVAGERHDLAAARRGSAAATLRARWRSGVRRSWLAGEDQRRHVGQRRSARAAAARRPARRRSRDRGCRRARCVGVERVEVDAGWALQERERFGQAGRGGRGRAATGTALSSQVVVANSASSTSSLLRRWRCRRQLGIRPSESSVQPQQRVGVAVQRRADRGRQQRPQRGVQVAGLEQIRAGPSSSSEIAWRVPVPSYTEPLSGAGGAAWRRASARSPSGSAVMPGAGAARAEFAHAPARSPGSVGCGTVPGRPAGRPSRAPALRRSGDSVRRTRARPWCRRRCRRGRAFRSRRRWRSASMSWTDSSLVKPAARGPISCAHCSKQLRCSDLALKRFERRARSAGPRSPVPRWSKTSRSRVPSAGAIAWAMNSRERQRRLAGPAGERDDGVVARLRRPRACARRSSEIVAGDAPARSSGTGSEAHAKPGRVGAGDEGDRARRGGAAPRRSVHRAASAPPPERKEPGRHRTHGRRRIADGGFRCAHRVGSPAGARAPAGRPIGQL